MPSLDLMEQSFDHTSMSLWLKGIATLLNFKITRCALTGRDKPTKSNFGLITQDLAGSHLVRFVIALVEMFQVYQHWLNITSILLNWDMTGPLTHMI